jgi:hypothetical protein
MGRAMIPIRHGGVGLVGYGWPPESRCSEHELPAKVGLGLLGVPAGQSAVEPAAGVEVRSQQVDPTRCERISRPPLPETHRSATRQQGTGASHTGCDRCDLGKRQRPFPQALGI